MRKKEDLASEWSHASNPILRLLVLLKMTSKVLSLSFQCHWTTRLLWKDFFKNLLFFIIFLEAFRFAHRHKKGQKNKVMSEPRVESRARRITSCSSFLLSESSVNNYVTYLLDLLHCVFSPSPANEADSLFPQSASFTPSTRLVALRSLLRFTCRRPLFLWAPPPLASGDAQLTE